MPVAKQPDAGGAVVVLIPLLGRMSVAGYDADDELAEVDLAVTALREIAERAADTAKPVCSFIGSDQPADPDLVRMGLMLLVSATARDQTTEINLWMTALSTLMPIRHYSVRVTMYVDAAPDYEVHPLKARSQEAVNTEGREIIEEMTGLPVRGVRDKAVLH